MKQSYSGFSTNLRALLPAVFLLFTVASFEASAQEFATVTPTTLELTLVQGESTVEQVSMTINPFCIRPYDVDVVASSPDALVANQTGVLVNGCGGDTSTFDVSITGTGTAQAYDLQFVDSEFGGVLASIPVSISTPNPCTLDLALSLEGGTLTFDFNLGTLQPADLNLYLSSFNRTYSLLQAPVALRFINPPLSTRATISEFPDFGRIGILATMATAEDGIICSAWQTIESSPGR